MSKPSDLHLMWSANSDYQELPLFILKKKAVVNVKNNDQRSFGYSILSAKYYQVGERNKRIKRRVLYDRLFNIEHLTNLPYPVSIPDMVKYEESLNLNINILSFSDEAGRVLTPLYISNKKANQSNIDLLYWRGHFAWIRNRNRLLSHLSKRKRGLHYCVRCFSHFISESKLNSHEVVCLKSTDSAPIIPSSSNSVYPNQSSTFLNNSTNSTTPTSNPFTTTICSTNHSTSKGGFFQQSIGPYNGTDVDLGDEPPRKRASTLPASDQPEQSSLHVEADLQIAEIAQLNAQTAQILQDIGDLPEIDVDGDGEVDVS